MIQAPNNVVQISLNVVVDVLMDPSALEISKKISYSLLGLTLS